MNNEKRLQAILETYFLQDSIQTLLKVSCLLPIWKAFQQINN